MRCRGCWLDVPDPVLDLGEVAAADHFPEAGTPVAESETAHPLEMAVCRRCGLAQLVTDDTTTEEPLGTEPQALRDQAAEAINLLIDAGLLRPGQSVAEFRSPHGGSWTPLALASGLVEAPVGEAADVVFDSFGMMHEPDQRSAAAARAALTRTDGTLLLQFHSLATIATHNQWMSLRHGHYAYYSLTALVELLGAAGMSITDAWEFPLYGGTVLVAARHGRIQPSAAVSQILATENRLALTSPAGLRGLQQSVSDMTERVRRHIDEVRASGGQCYAYGAASRAVAVFTLADLDRSDITAIADASPGKQGRRMPGTDVPIISPDALVAASPDSVWLTLPDLRDEVAAAFPTLADRFVILD